MVKVTVLVSALILCLAFTVSASAQEPAKQEVVAPEAAVPAAPASVPAPEEAADFEVVYGEVKSIDINTRAITLETYDYEEEKEVTVTYTIKPDAELEGVSSLSDVKAGDWVDLELQEDESGNMVVSFIAVEKEPVEDIVEEGIVE